MMIFQTLILFFVMITTIILLKSAIFGSAVKKNTPKNIMVAVAHAQEMNFSDFFKRFLGSEILNDRFVGQKVREIIAILIVNC